MAVLKLETRFFHGASNIVTVPLKYIFSIKRTIGFIRLFLVTAS